MERSFNQGERCATILPPRPAPGKVEVDRAFCNVKDAGNGSRK
jgi:hypothetical protein